MPTTAKQDLAPDRKQSSECSGDQDLVLACRQGDLSAFERLYSLHGPRMKSLAWNLLGDRSDAEDAVQETFLKIYNHLGKFRGESAFSTWIFRLLMNTCYDLTRKRKRYPTPLSSQDEIQPDSPSYHMDHPLRMTLERSLQRLDMRTRSVFLLFEVEGFGHREIAGILQIPEGTSKALLFEAKRKLQDLIGKRIGNS